MGTFRGMFLENREVTSHSLRLLTLLYWGMSSTSSKVNARGNLVASKVDLYEDLAISYCEEIFYRLIGTRYLVGRGVPSNFSLRIMK